MKKNLTQKIIESHLQRGDMIAGTPIELSIDQTLTQDATGTLVMLEFEAFGIEQVQTELSAQYVDHNLIQADFKNPDDHLFLKSACQKYGVWYSPPDNGVSHPVHMEKFGIPGKTLLGSDSHTCAAGSLGMLAIGVGGLQVAAAMAGQPFEIKMPKVMGVKLTGELPDWVSAKDVILEMLRRHSVKGGVGKVIEYYGPGLANLGAMDRHVIANMGQELGATTSLFPADDAVRRFLKQQGREQDYVELTADPQCDYDEHDEIALSSLQPLIACPSSPDNVVPVSEVAGEPIYQSYIGSSANPGMRDFMIPAAMLENQQVAEGVSFDVNPTSRQMLENITHWGALEKLIHAGARLHQTGCNGCIGMGQAPASDRNSLRTVPRNFPGRSGTVEDAVYLCSPETATASAINGEITDPRTLTIPYPTFEEPETLDIYSDFFVKPKPNPELVALDKGPNISTLPELDPIPEKVTGQVLIRVEDNVSTDTILPAGLSVLPFRSNIPEISKFTFQHVDEDFHRRAQENPMEIGFIVGGENYGQGSSREHAALAPRYLGIRSVFAKSFARIHRRNLINFGVLPLLYQSENESVPFERDDKLHLELDFNALENSEEVRVQNETQDTTINCQHDLTPDEISILKAGGLINWIRQQAA